MKAYSRIFTAAALSAFMVACADQDVKDFHVDRPQDLDAIEALNAYGNIKDYVDRAAYPNFKIACALGAADYNERGVVYRVANSNFDEITLGNAMKYASVVADDGSMNFSTIAELLDNAEAAGMSVYGHTLAWHAQQNVTYLKSLLADAQVEIGPEDLIIDQRVSYEEVSEYPFSVLNGFVPEVVDGLLHANMTNKKHQFYMAENVPTVAGQQYEIKFMIRASKAVSVTIRYGAGKDEAIKVDAGPEFKIATINFTAPSDNLYLLVDPANNKFEVDIQFVQIGHYPPDHRELTEQEKYDNIVGAMNAWVYGMMEACDGRVKAWDLINEAIGGGGNVNGYYDLQHDSGSATDFFWQDVLGSENYGPVVEKAARAAFAEYGGNPADLILFVNDYNLESDWDNNKKVKSMVYWVGEWEKRGAHIDGLSSQMHISYYENRATMKSKADHYVNMLHIMAETGKLVRISELDMGYVDINGNDVATADMTPEQLQNMANYYRFIIQMYLKIVPKEQQYSICQWCLTDAPAKSGWRADTPVGLWTLDWARKPAYAAYCEALKAPVPSTEDFFEYLQANGLTHYISE